MTRQGYRQLWVKVIVIVIVGLLSAQGGFAQTATIGGKIYTGAQMEDPPGSGIFVPVFAPAATPLFGASVMVQNQHSGGAFITYATVTGNSWSATVPAPTTPGDSAEYVIMFSAPGHDLTSRPCKVHSGDVVLDKDAYLPPLFTDPQTGNPSPDELPLANLLVYCFRDNVVNGEDDFPDDPGMSGVLIEVIDEDGNVVQSGISGSSPTLPPAAGPDVSGLYFFTGLVPGEYHVRATPPGGAAQWHWTTSEEGTQEWEVILRPGDPGTEGGIYLIWFGFVPKLGKDMVTGNARIHGTLFDADGADPVDVIPPDLVCVTGNDVVPDGFVVLYTDAEALGPPHPVATTLADPVTGEYEFLHVPPGRYKLFFSDVPIDYVYSQGQVAVGPTDTDLLVDALVPRFFARTQGFVKDLAGNPIANARVTFRLKPHNIWKETTTDANGWYNFDNLEEVEVLGWVSVEPPPGYRWADVVGDSLNAHDCLSIKGKHGTRVVQFAAGLNYRADLFVEQIPATEGDICGFTFYDRPTRSTGWTPDGIWQEDEEPTVQGVVVELLDATGTTVLATDTSGAFDEAALAAQGWIKPFTVVPVTEFGGVFNGPLMGHYEFRGIAPGNYKLRMTPPPGHSATVPAPFVAGAPVTVDITVTGGQRTEHNFGLTTRVPIAGLIEGGIFDDVFLDNNPLSTFFEEKAVVTGAPVVVYDHLGYTLDAFQQPSPLCYEAAFNTPLCDRPDLGDEVEIERRLAPGVHIYVGNDPTHPAFNPGYFPLALNYAFGQGTAKFEADWSLLPVTFVQGIPLPGNVVAGNTPLIFPPGFPLVSPNKGFEKKVKTVGFRKRDDVVINNGAVTVTPGTTYRIQGQNFGEAQGYSTVSLLGEALRVVEWHDTYIDVFIPRKALSGSLIVATTTGISNALPIDIPDNSWRRRFKNLRFVYVDASNTGPEDGSKFHPWNTINEALNHLPKRKPRYIIVAPGTYKERIHITESNIKLIGAGPHETTIDGRAGQFNVDESGASTAFGPVIHIGNGPNSKKHVRNVVISGFTITGGTVNSDDIGAGIFGDYDNRFIDINNCIIVQNGGYYGGGIWLYKNNHNIRIWSNLIAENGNFGGFAGGISVNDEPYSTDNDPQPEHLPDDFNPGPPPGTYEIFNNLIFHNWSPDAGGGVTLYEVKDHLKVYGNVIAENFAYDHGGGMFFEDCGPVDVYGNIFLRNVCYDDGGAISFEDVGDTLSHVNVYNNLFAQNIADDKGENHARGAALAFDDTFYGKVFNNTITGNIVAGSEDPAGGAIDSERNGHEYSGLDGPFKAPGYSDPEIYNNIIWDNWRLHYDQPIDAGEEEDLDYTYGRNYVWTPDELHVDNPALQGEWETDKNSESFTHVRYNDIAGGYLSGVNNLDIDPMFVDPSNSNWRLKAGSPVIDKAKASLGPNVDLELITRSPSHGKIDMGAFEWHAGPIIVRLPTGILNAIQVPVPGSPSPNP